MKSFAFTDFLIGVGVAFFLEGLLFLASPSWMRRAMESTLAASDRLLRVAGVLSALGGLALIWMARH
ncbi:DUF2065 domain-containing protein [Rhodopseudomonas pseudopalustris]|uniref:DUF2065 domain-containing protein n=1 Tax=Rhodopseudomonas pseudopalustris TaxID=1513892 RepID=UPI000C9F9790